MKENKYDMDLFKHRLQLHCDSSTECTILGTWSDELRDKVKEIDTTSARSILKGVFR